MAVLIGGLFFTPSQTPVDEPQERSYPAMIDATIPDNEHARTQAIEELERTRVAVAEQKRIEEEKRKKQIAEAERQKKEKAEELRKVALVRAKESAVTPKKQVSSPQVTAKEPEKAKVQPKAQPKKQVVVSRSTKTEAPTRIFEATFYTAFCDTGCTGVTATGFDVSNTIYANGVRIIAVDPSVIPLRSIVRVTLEDGTSFNAIALDTGGAIDGYRIDILVGSKDEARKFGRQRATVKILK